MSVGERKESEIIDANSEVYNFSHGGTRDPPYVENKRFKCALSALAHQLLKSLANAALFEVLLMSKGRKEPLEIRATDVWYVRHSPVPHATLGPSVLVL